MYKFEETIEKLRLEHTIAGMAVAVTDRDEPGDKYGVITLMNTKHTELRNA